MNESQQDLTRYDAMRHQLAECARIDEAAEIRDKAAALSAYARQRDDTELEVWVNEIHQRACMRIGQLSSELEKARFRDGPKTAPRGLTGETTKSDALKHAGINRKTAHRYEKLAGGKDKEKREAASAAADAHFAKARANGKPSTMEGLAAAVNVALGIKAERAPKQDRAVDAVLARIRAGDPIDRPGLAKQLGVGEATITIATAVAHERIRLIDALDLDTSSLSQSAKAKLEAFAHRLRVKLEAEFEQRVQLEVKRRLAERDAEDVLAIEQANELIASNTGRLRPPLTPQEYHTVLWALHPDNQSEQKVADAFVIMRRKKPTLCLDGPIQRQSPPLPDTFEEVKRRRQREGA